LLSDFILGSQDGLVNVLGIILGMSAATRDVQLILVATLAALGAETVSMGAVAYTSTAAKRRFYMGTLEKEKTELKGNSKLGYDEGMHMLKTWGFRGRELEEGARRIAENPKAMLDLMMSYGLKLAPVGKNEARRSFVVVLASTLVGSAIPIGPFLFVGNNVLTGAIASVVASAMVLSFIGFYEAKVTRGSLWKNAIQMVVIGLTAGFAGFLIGHFLGT
jgi:predicted membrane protein (TIGR00267 family)